MLLRDTNQSPWSVLHHFCWLYQHLSISGQQEFEQEQVVNGKAPLLNLSLKRTILSLLTCYINSVFFPSSFLSVAIDNSMLRSQDHKLNLEQHKSIC